MLNGKKRTVIRDLIFMVIDRKSTVVTKKRILVPLGRKITMVIRIHVLLVISKEIAVIKRKHILVLIGRLVTVVKREFKNNVNAKRRKFNFCPLPLAINLYLKREYLFAWNFFYFCVQLI